MSAQPQERVRKRLVWFSPLLLVVALSPAFLQTQYTCNRTGDTRLSSLELEVEGVDRLAFDPTVRVYDLWLPTGTTQATVRAVPMDPAARVTWYVPDGAGMLASGSIGVGGGEVTIDLPPDGYSLYIGVFPPGGATNTYIVAMNPVCPQGDACYNGGRPGTCVNNRCEFAPFPCTEQGILDAIAFGGGPLYFACDGPTTVTTQAKIVIDNDVILDGRGDLTIDAGKGDSSVALHGVLDVDVGTTAELRGVTLTGGECLAHPTPSQDPGGSVALSNSGVLRIVSSSVSGNNYGHNQFTNYYPCSPGGISNTGTLTLIDSDVSQNSATGGAGGISNTGTLSLIRSQVRQNGSFNGTSAIRNDGTMALVDSDVSDNAVGGTRNGPGVGSAIVNSGTMLLKSSAVVRNYNGHPTSRTISSSGPATLINTTVAGNYSVAGGSYTGAVTQSAGVLELASSTISGSLILLSTSGSGEIRATNSVISSTSSFSSACAGSIIDGGGNLESPGDSCGFAVSGVPSESLNLGPLADNGGLTETMALLPGSVAIDMIDSAACLDADGAPLTEDQRGLARPQGSQCDAGAFEWADCSGTPCDDGNDCTADHCEPLDTSWCAHTTLADGTFCGVDGVCEAGACRERSWGTAVLIEADDGSASRPQVAVDPNGNATAVWAQSDGNGYSNIWSNRYTPGGGWDTAVLIGTDDVGRGWAPQVAVDPNGNATAVWRQWVGSAYYNIWANRYTPGGGWDTAVLIGTDDSRAGIEHARSAHVSVDPNGNATVVWGLFSGALWSNRYTPGGGWDTAVLIGTGSASRSGQQPQVTVDPEGNATVVWRQYDGTRHNIWANRYTPGGGWDTGVLIETDDAGNAGLARVAVDPYGNATAVWQKSDGSIWNTWSNRYTPGGGSLSPSG